MNAQSPGIAGVILARVFALVLLGSGIFLIVNGAHLLNLGGSPYYFLAGMAVGVSGILVWLRRAEAMAVYGAMLLLTLTWALLGGRVSTAGR